MIPTRTAAGFFLALVGCAPAALPVRVDVPLERVVLANGLEVIMLPDHHVPEVSVRVRYHVGSKDEAPREYGLSHYLEHLTYAGSAHTERDTYFARMHELGATDLNGSTSFDATDYYFTVPTASLAQGLWVERERMHFAVDGIDEERAKRELHIVESECRLSQEETELGNVIDRAISATVPGYHPYAHMPIGSMTALAALDLHRDVLPYYRAHYAPNQATLVIAGDIDPRQTRALVNRMFGDLPPVAPRPERAIDTQVRPDPVRLYFEAQGENAALVAAWLMPPEDGKDYETARVALQKLASIARSQAQHDDLLVDLDVSFQPRRFASVGWVVMRAKKGVDVTRLVGTLAEASSRFEEYKRDGWVGDARAQCIIGQVFELASNSARAERIADLSAYGKSTQVQAELQRCMQIERDPINAWGSDYFTPAHAVLAFVHHVDSAPAAGREVKK